MQHVCSYHYSTRGLCRTGRGCCFLAVEYGIPMSVQALLTPGVEAAQVNGLRRSYVCPCDLVLFASGGEKSSRFHTSASEEVRGFFRHCCMLKGFWNDTLEESLWLYRSLWLKKLFVITTCSKGCGTGRLRSLSGSIRAFGRCCKLYTCCMLHIYIVFVELVAPPPPLLLCKYCVRD